MRFPAYSPDLSRERLSASSEVCASAAEKLVDLLGDPWLETETEAGNVTVAMIRPDLAEAVNIQADDIEAAEVIEKHIEGLAILAKFAVHFDETALDEFYAGQPKDVQIVQEPMRDLDKPTRWHEFMGLMVSGPTTVLLLHDPSGDAIKKWRDQVGHWNIEANHDPATLRGHFGVDNYNNLIHGSDAPESAMREIGIIKDCLLRNLSAQ